MMLSSGRVHFVGIGGAGMSAIAKVLIERGMEVSGSDLKGSRVATMLEAMGADIHIGHDARLVEGAHTVIVSSAIPSSNPELSQAAELGIEVLTRGAALAAILQGRRSIVVSGTHGKTTTTSMIATVLREARLDPTYLIGAGLNDIGTNARAGSGEVAVAESDESDGSFLLLSPSVAVVTNIEMDHHDHWASLDELRDAFGAFIDSGPTDGAIVVPNDDADMVGRAIATGRTVLTFGDGGHIFATDVVHEGGSSAFTLVSNDDRCHVSLKVPGDHNIANAVCAAAACRLIGVDLASIAGGLNTYRGVERRFQIRGTRDGVTVIDDYAHHPTEVRAALAAARSGRYKRVVAVFQPHRYSRTSALAADFGKAFSDADVVAIMDVYGAGESPVPGVSGKLIADLVARDLPGREVVFLGHRAQLLEFLAQATRDGDALMTIGAGDVTTIGEEFLAWGGEA
jgi:UDP-N-acetylmuramate--alanine ligase